MIEWISIPEYSKRTGLSRVNINKLIREEKLIAEKTDGGGQIRIKMEENTEFLDLKDEMLSQRRMLEKLINHLGVK